MPISDEAVAPGNAEYEKLRTRFFSTRVPNAYPAKIFTPRTTVDVQEIVHEAKSTGTKVGVRSGGHLFPCASLIDKGILIDTVHLNKMIDYNPQTRQVSFPPGARSKDLASALEKIGRFFPVGHDPTVAAGGFLLAGGQGWFMRGWGCTSDMWVTEMEMVMPSGDVVRASKSQNEDLFWAARGSGQGFFAVVTRIWGTTISMKHMFETTFAFNCTSNFEEILEAIFALNDRTPKYGVEVALTTFRPDRFEAGLDEQVHDRRVFMGVSVLAFTNTIDEAAVLVSPWVDLPEVLKKFLLVVEPLAEKSWEELFAAQDNLLQRGNGERYQCDSILDHADIPRNELIKAIKPAMCDLPTRRSVGCIYIGDYTPNELDQAISLPQHYYIATMTCWTDPSWDDRMREWMKKAYAHAAPASCGQYIADYDATQRITPVMSDRALKRFLQIRESWDPKEMFIGYHGLKHSTSAKFSL
ncbi:hypothetical protein N7490_008295 [Penicillium lividum]|nr:hypothetical protein N7490_008295 [Penicillium lividum]